MSDNIAHALDYALYVSDGRRGGGLLYDRHRFRGMEICPVKTTLSEQCLPAKVCTEVAYVVSITMIWVLETQIARQNTQRLHAFGA